MPWTGIRSSLRKVLQSLSTETTTYRAMASNEPSAFHPAAAFEVDTSLPAATVASAVAQPPLPLPLLSEGMDEEEKADVRSDAPPKEDEPMAATSHDASEEGKQRLPVTAAPSLSSIVPTNSLLLPLPVAPAPAPLPLFFSDPEEASLDHDFDDDFDVDLAVAATDAAVAAAASAAATVADTTSLQQLPVEQPSVRSPVQAQQVQPLREQLANGVQRQQQQQIAAEPLHDAAFATAASLLSAPVPDSTTEQDAPATACAPAVAESAAPVVCFACRQAEWPGAPLLGCLACGNRFHNWDQCRGGGSNDLCSECAAAGMDDEDADGEDHPLAAGGGGRGSKFYATLAHRPPTGGSNGSGAAHAMQAPQQHQGDEEDRPLRHTMLARSIHEAVRLSQHAAAPQQTETIDLTDD